MGMWTVENDAHDYDNDDGVLGFTHSIVRKGCGSITFSQILFGLFFCFLTLWLGFVALWVWDDGGITNSSSSIYMGD